MKFVRCAAMAVAILSAAGCDWEASTTDHDPKPGKGAIVIENNTGSKINVYIDGRSFGQAGDFDEKAIDLNPGVYRVVLDESGGSRTYRDDVDVILGKNTILDVAADPFDTTRYDVAVFIESP